MKTVSMMRINITLMTLYLCTMVAFFGTVWFDAQILVMGCGVASIILTLSSLLFSFFGLGRAICFYRQNQTGRRPASFAIFLGVLPSAALLFVIVFLASIKVDRW